MRVRRVLPADFDTGSLVGALLCRDVALEGGSVRKGVPLNPDDVERLRSGGWEALHVADLEPDELLEGPAGERIARALAGEGVEVGPFSGGYWPVTARVGGLLEVRTSGLQDLNLVPGVAVCTLLDGHVVDAGELVARIKIVPFAVAESEVARAEGLCSGPLVSVRSLPQRGVGALAVESLSATAAERFEVALGDKLAWLGSELRSVAYVEDRAQVVSERLERLVSQGLDLVLIAGSKGMDPLDPSLQALESLGASWVARGVPVFPGTLIWLARLGETPVVGLPSCGLFSKATVVDVLLPRLLAGPLPEPGELADLGHGGLLRPELGYRLPGYRGDGGRGRV